MLTDVALWFARNKDNKYSTIFEIDDNNKDQTYTCPVCLSKVIPKGIKESSQVSSHFAHLDASKCNAESLIHWCYKNNFLIVGGEFGIIDRETGHTTSYVCKSIAIEKQISKDGLNYRPDVTVETATGETIFFEMNYRNRKKTEDYINVWLALNCTVIEVDIKALLQLNSNGDIFLFNPIFDKGKCYGRVSKNKRANDNIIHLKESVYKKRSDIAKDFVNNLDWFWRDLANYKLNKCGIDVLHLSLDYLIQNIDDEDDRRLLFEIIGKFKCNQILETYNDYKWQIIEPIIKGIFERISFSNWYSFSLGTTCRTGLEDDVPRVQILGKGRHYPKCFDFDKYSVEDIVQNVENYIAEDYKSLIFEYMTSHSSYKFPQYFDDKEIHLSVSYHQNGIYLARYDFVYNTQRLKELKSKVEKYKANQNYLVLEKGYTTARKINKEIKYTDEQLNCELYKALYPIIYIVNHSKDKEISIRLNPDFTKDENGRTRRWIIKDFIEELELLNIENIANDKGRISIAK